MTFAKKCEYIEKVSRNTCCSRFTLYESAGTAGGGTEAEGADSRLWRYLPHECIKMATSLKAYGRSTLTFVSEGALLMKDDYMKADASAHQIFTRRDVRISSVRAALPNIAGFIMPVSATAPMVAPKDDNSCHDLALAAGRELSAFVAAVDESYGRERARSAEAYWLDLLANTDSHCGMDGAWFRQVTIQAATKLATDLTGIPPYDREEGR